ncbi:MAG: hypothetical protein R8K21_04335 [Mariprofundales bacterium]
MNTGIELGTQHAYWALVFMGLMYIIGNGIWVNQVVRNRRWLGAIMWLCSTLLVLIAAALLEARMDAQNIAILDRLTNVDIENHWIAISLYALLSLPGACCVLFGQHGSWVRFSLALPAIIVFIPAGMQTNADANNILVGLGLGGGVAGFVLLWQFMLDDNRNDKVASQT